MIGLLIFVIIFILIGAWFKNNHVSIKFKTFFRKKLNITSGPWGVYTYVGKQGSGKTYSVIEFLEEHKSFKIYSNLSSLKNVPFTYIGTFEELLQIDNENGEDIIIFFDEIFTALSKSDKLTKEVLAFLSQMRKKKIIFLTTAQEWLEINITLRRYVRFQVDCNIIHLFGIPILKKTFHDGDLIKWDHLENDYVSPIIQTTYSKMNKNIGKLYDTFEVVQTSKQKTRT